MESIRFIIFDIIDNTHNNPVIRDIIEVPMYTKHGNIASNSLGNYLGHLKELYSDSNSYQIRIEFC